MQINSIVDSLETVLDELEYNAWIDCYMSVDVDELYEYYINEAQEPHKQGA